jgi:hypothetical protein
MHALRQRGEQLGAPPLRERRQGCVRRTGDEVDRSIAQNLVRPVVGEDQLMERVQPVLPEAAELDRGDGREIRVRYQIRHRDACELHSRISAGATLNSYSKNISPRPYLTAGGHERCVNVFPLDDARARVVRLYILGTKPDDAAKIADTYRSSSNSCNGSAAARKAIACLSMIRRLGTTVPKREA